MDRRAWKAAVHGVAEGRTWLSDFTFTFHFHALEKEMATHSSVLAWRIPGTGVPGGLPSMGSHRVGHDWSNLAAAADAQVLPSLCLLTRFSYCLLFSFVYFFLLFCLAIPQASVTHPAGLSEDITSSRKSSLTISWDWAKLLFCFLISLHFPYHDLHQPMLLSTYLPLSLSN